MPYYFPRKIQVVWDIFCKCTSTLMVPSKEELMRRLLVKNVRHQTPRPWPRNTCVHLPSFRLQIRIVLSPLPVTRRSWSNVTHSTLYVWEYTVMLFLHNWVYNNLAVPAYHEYCTDRGKHIATYNEHVYHPPVLVPFTVDDVTISMLPVELQGQILSIELLPIGVKAGLGVNRHV